MNTGKALFAQPMGFLPWTRFPRCVARYDGDKGVRTLTCAEQFRVTAFAQLIYRESLRDIEVCRSAQDAKRYHMGFRELETATLAALAYMPLHLQPMCSHKALRLARLARSR